MDDQPATKRDLQELEQRFDQRIDAVQNDLTQKIDQQFETLQEMIRDNQTELLKAFLPFQEVVQMRFRRLEVAGETDTGRLDILERRVYELEKKNWQPPPVA